MKRRDFLKATAFTVAGGLIAPGLLQSCKDNVTTNKNIGLQLYSLRDMYQDEGIEAVLKAAAKMGYKNLEIANYEGGKMYKLKPEELKKMIDDLGMKVTSSHVGKAYNKDDEEGTRSWWGEAIEAHNKLGVKYMIQPWMPVNDSTTLDDIKLYCDYFSSVGMQTAASSISFGYHNHAFEFKKIDDQLIYDYLLQNVSKNHVNFQLDVYWIEQGGYSAVEYMKKYASQIKTLHIKDDKEIGASGKMDFKAIFNQAKENNIKDWYVEVEEYTNNNPQESVLQSIDFLKKEDYVF